MLIERIKTAAVLLLILAAALYLGGFVLVLLALIVVAILNYEFYSFALPYALPRKLQLVVCGLLPAGCYLLLGWHGFAVGIWLAIVISFSLHLIEINYSEHQPDLDQALPAATLGLVYCSFLASLLVVVAAENSGVVLLTWLFCVVIASDSGAYLVGRFLGKRKIAPRISPNKTLAGAIGGLLSAIAAGVAVAFYLPIADHWMVVLLFALIAGVLAQLGDLVESLIKRSYNVKDSGQLLPGHGGLLDRLDALIFASPVLLFLEVQGYA